jgi:hypothetical protein
MVREHIVGTAAQLAVRGEIIIRKSDFRHCTCPRGEAHYAPQQTRS